VDFKNTVIIMTSNIGARLINREQGIGLRNAQQVDEDARGYESMKGKVTEEMKKVFRPEFLNRIDEMIVFHALTSNEINQIVHLMLARVKTQVRQQNMDLEVSDEAMMLMAKEGFDPTYGARPLRRAVQRMVEDPLAEEILMGNFKEGDTILADVKDGDIVFVKAAPGEDDAIPPMEEPAGVA
jgi:ATP-dependent Clp protease ATP-binding subunit ClpC